MELILLGYIRKLTFWVAVMVGFAPIVCAGTVEDQLNEINRLPEKARSERLEKEARKEGEVVWYAAMASDRAGELIRAFESKYSYLKVRKPPA